jgi:hypothetical protein
MNPHFTPRPEAFLPNYLAKLSDLGVNAQDAGLVKLCQQCIQAGESQVLLNAHNALSEAVYQHRVKNENGFIKSAIKEKWRPRYSCFKTRPSI